MQEDTILLRSNEEDMRVLVGFKGLIVGHRNSFLQALGGLLVGLLGGCVWDGGQPESKPRDDIGSILGVTPQSAVNGG